MTVSGVRGEDGEATCEDGPCDHCRPDDWHGCVRPAGHRGYHSCEPDIRDRVSPLANEIGATLFGPGGRFSKGAS